MKKLIPLIVAAPLCLAACSRLTPPADNDKATVADTTNATTRTKPADTPKAARLRMVGQALSINQIRSDPFQMGEVSLDGDTLTVHVTYAGGAKEHDFALYWDGLVAESDPAQAWITLKHDANGDAAEALITKTLSFDVSSLPDDWRTYVYVLSDHGGRATIKRGKNWR